MKINCNATSAIVDSLFRLVWDGSGLHGPVGASNRGAAGATGKQTALYAFGSLSSRAVTIYRYDGIPRCEHVRLSYHVHLLIYVKRCSTARAWQDFACAAPFTTRAVLCRAVTIYRYDGIPRYKHVPCTFAYLRYLEKIKDAVSHLHQGNNFPLNCSLAPPHVQRRQHQKQRPLSLISIPCQKYKSKLVVWE